MDGRRSWLAMLQELEPIAGSLLNRHEKMAEEWFPHDYVPWSQGRDFDVEPWTPDQPTLTGVARTAFEVNLLTEDNLPSYHRLVYDTFFRGDGAWINWVHRWTAEEGRHAIVLRDYLTVTRNTDPVQLERDRMQLVMTGYERVERDPLQGFAYVSFQELATRIAHRNTGRYSEDPVADRIMARIAADENLHMVFYRDVLDAAMEVDPSWTTIAIVNEATGFQMPGVGIRDFGVRAVEIAQAGIYDLRTHHDEVLLPLLKHWELFERGGLDAEAQRAVERMAAFLEGLDRLATRYEAEREEQREQARTRG